MFRRPPSGSSLLQRLGTQFVTADHIRLLNARISGPATSRVCDPALLEAIVNRLVDQVCSGKEKDLNWIVGTFGYELANARVFVNGNKRTAVLAAGLLRLQNGMKLRQIASQDVGNDAMAQIHRGVASGTVDEAEFTEVCRQLWKSAANVDEGRSTGDRIVGNAIKFGEILTDSFAASNKESRCHTKMAILRSRWNEQAPDKLTRCVVDGSPFSSIVVDESVGRLLARILIGDTAIAGIFGIGLSFTCRREMLVQLVFPQKGNASDSLHLSGDLPRRMLVSDAALDHPVVSPHNVLGSKYFA